MTFKAAYVRQTMDHQVIAPSVFGFAALALLPFCFAPGNGRLLKSFAAGTAFAMLFIALPANIPLSGIPPVLTYPALLLGNVADTIARLPQAIKVLSGQSTLQSDYDRRMAEIKNKNELGDIGGSVDIMPTEIGVLLAAKYNYQPRPVIQSYLAYQPSLLTINDKYFQSAQAPDYIVLQEMKDIYDYYPTLYDGPSWLRLLERYQVKERRAGGLLLQKKASPTSITLHPLGTIDFEEGQTVVLKNSDKNLLFARINLATTAIGSLQKLFFRIYPPRYSVTLADGKKFSAVAPSADLKEGFIVSPYVCRPEEIEALYSSQPLSKIPSNRVIDLTIAEQKNDFPWHAFASKGTIELFSLEQSH